MKYDIEVLQTFQDTLELVKLYPFYNQQGICSVMKESNFPRSYEFQHWMHNKYMPNMPKDAYWWPKDFRYHSDKELEQAKQDRIQFLERIIEDLMSGE